MKNILKFWNFSDVHIQKITNTTWNIDDRYVLKKNLCETTISKNIGIMKTLQMKGLPTPNVILTMQQDEYIEVDNQYYMVTEKLTGKHLDVRDVLANKGLSQKIGKIIGELQLGLKEAEDTFDFADNDFLVELNGWIKKSIESFGDGFFAAEVFEECLELMEGVYPSIQRQPIHRDIHLGNILFEGEEIVGYIDFDISQINARMFDIAYMAVGILAEVFEDIELRNNWLSFLEELKEGYKLVISIDEKEENSVWLLIVSIEMLFVAYFLSNGNNELAVSADKVLKWVWSLKFNCL